MQDKFKHMQGDIASAALEDPRDDSVKALEDGLMDLYLDVETVWLIARDHFGMSDEYLLKRVEANLRVMKLATEGIILRCDKCGRPSSFGPSGIRKNCYYCGEELSKPKSEDLKDITPLFIPPKMGMADIDIIGVSISASYSYASPLSPGKAAKAQNSSENTRLNTKAQQLYNACQRLDERYRLIYPILFSLADLIFEKLIVSPSEFVGTFLSRPIDNTRADTCFFYPYTLLSVIWRYITLSGNIENSRYEEMKKQLVAKWENGIKNDEFHKITCSNCGRVTSPTGHLYLKCPYCLSRLREITYSDVFPSYF